MKKIAALPAENPRERKSRIGSIGSRARRSQATKTASSTPPAASEPITSRLPHPASLDAHEAPDDAERGRGDEHEPADVERALPGRSSHRHA